METLRPSSYFPNLNLWMQASRIAIWTKEENKRFEEALAIFDEQSPDRWFQVAALIPGKSASDVWRHYKELEADVSDIEAGLVPIPGYLTSSFTLEMVDSRGFDEFRKRNLMGRGSDQERKKGVPWTEDEHRLGFCHGFRLRRSFWFRDYLCLGRSSLRLRRRRLLLRWSTSNRLRHRRPSCRKLERAFHLHKFTRCNYLLHMEQHQF
ncbi:unnamed protein product [Camellia sinensis]